VFVACIYLSKKVLLFVVGGEIPLKGKQHKVWLHIIYKRERKMSQRQQQRQLTVNFQKIMFFLNQQSNNSASAPRFFDTLYVTSIARLRREIGSSLVMENVHARRQISLSNSETEYESLKTNSRRVRLNLTKSGSKKKQ